MDGDWRRFGRYFCEISSVSLSREDNDNICFCSFGGGEWIKLLIQNLFPCFLDREEMRNVVVAKSNEVSEKWNWHIYSGIHQQPHELNEET